MKYVIGILIVVGLALGIKSCVEKQQEEMTVSRVSALFPGMKKDDAGNDMETAIRAWSSEAVISEPLVSGFDRWRAEKGLKRSLSSAEVASVEKGSGSDYVVSVRFEGKPYRILVPQSSRMSWVN